MYYISTSHIGCKFWKRYLRYIVDKFTGRWRDTVRVEDNGLYLFSFSYFYFYFIYFLIFGLRVKVSITLQTIIQHNIASHTTQKNVEDSRTIILYYISTAYSIYAL